MNKFDTRKRVQCKRENSTSQRTLNLSEAATPPIEPLPTIEPLFVDYGDGFLMDTSIFSADVDVEGFFVDTHCFYVNPCTGVKRRCLESPYVTLTVEEETHTNGMEIVALEVDEEVPSTKFAGLPQARGVSSLVLSAFYQEGVGHNEQNESSYCSTGDLNKLLEESESCFIGVNHFKRQLRRANSLRVKTYNKTHSVKHNKQRRKKVHHLTSKHTCIKKRKFTDELPEACAPFEASPLPSLSSSSLPLKPALLAPFLFLSEFLNTFHTSLKMNTHRTAAELYDLLVKRGNLVDIYKKLLIPLVINGEKNGRWMPRKQCKLEKLAMKYLRDNGIGKFMTPINSIEDTIVILNLLCHAVLESGTLAEPKAIRTKKLTDKHAFITSSKICSVNGAELRKMNGEVKSSIEEVEANDFEKGNTSGHRELHFWHTH